MVNLKKEKNQEGTRGITGTSLPMRPLGSRCCYVIVFLSHAVDQLDGLAELKLGTWQTRRTRRRIPPLSLPQRALTLFGLTLFLSRRAFSRLSG